MSAPAASASAHRNLGIDGLRGLATIAVVLYHLGLTWGQGGYQGVTVFLVLSGYFITLSLVRELDETGRLDYGRFWSRRLWRLMPSMIVLVVVVAALCTLFNHVMLTKMRSDIIPSLLFFNNWWQVIQDVSYFEALGDPSPLTHFWSLAVEVQLYLAWSLILWAAYAGHLPKKWIRRGTLVLAAISAVLMAVLYDPSVDASRVYYGTDTRAFSFLIGAWLALLPEGTIEDASSHNCTLATTLEVAGAASIVGLVVIFICTNDYTSFQYYGGTLLCSVLALLIVAACLVPDGWLGKLLSWRPLVWVGSRSYSIYLWHYPLLCLMNPSSDVTDPAWWELVLQLVLVLAVAELAYRFVEKPLRHGFSALAKKRSDRSRSSSRERNRGHSRTTVSPSTRKINRAIPLVTSVIVLGIAVCGLVFVEDTSALSEEGAALIEEGDDDDADAPTLVASADEDEVATNEDDFEAEPDESSDLSDEAEESDDLESDESAETDTGAAVETNDSEGEESAEADASGEDDATDSSADGAFDVLLIGDSVSLRAESIFYDYFPDGYIDALKNRQFSDGIDLYEWYEANGYVGDTVVFALGTNGPVTDELVDELMDAVGDSTQVYFVNTRSNTSWVSTSNSALANAAYRYSNVHLIDWYSYSSGRSDVFDGDGTHLSASGAEEYLQLIQNAIGA